MESGLIFGSLPEEEAINKYKLMTHVFKHEFFLFPLKYFGFFRSPT